MSKTHHYKEHTHTHFVDKNSFKKPGVHLPLTNTAWFNNSLTVAYSVGCKTVISLFPSALPRSWLKTMTTVYFYLLNMWYVYLRFIYCGMKTHDSESRDQEEA